MAETMRKSVIAVVDDLFFASKIRGTAERLGVHVVFAKKSDDVFEAAKTETPSLIIADLHSHQCDPFELAVRLKSDDELRPIPLLGFFSHVQTDLQREAETAGFDRVMPRSAFTINLAKILRGD